MLVYFTLVTKVVAFFLTFFLHIYIQARYPHKAFFVLDLDSFDLSPRVPREKRHLITVLVSHREIPLLPILLMGDNGTPLFCRGGQSTLLSHIGRRTLFFGYNFFGECLFTFKCELDIKCPLKVKGKKKYLIEMVVKVSKIFVYKLIEYKRVWRNENRSSHTLSKFRFKYMQFSQLV